MHELLGAFIVSAGIQSKAAWSDVHKREGSEAGEGRVTYSSPSRYSRTLDGIQGILMPRTSLSPIFGRNLPVRFRRNAPCYTSRLHAR